MKILMIRFANESVVSFQWMDHYAVILTTVNLPNIGLSFTSFLWIKMITPNSKIFESLGGIVVRKDRKWELFIKPISVL